MTKASSTLSGMRHTLAAVAALLLLAGCSPAPVTVVTVTAPAPAESSAASSDPNEITPTPSPAAPTTAATSERGNVPKKLGEQGVLLDGRGDAAAKFTVTKIETGFKCTSSYADPAENGQYVGIWMEIQTTKVINFDADDGLTVPYFNPGDWQVVGTDGTTENDSEGNGSSCARDRDRLPSQLGPNKKVKGVVVVDTKFKHGYLELIQDYAETGWEWQF